jgi:hypothetical protein
VINQKFSIATPSPYGRIAWHSVQVTGWMTRIELQTRAEDFSHLSGIKDGSGSTKSPIHYVQRGSISREKVEGSEAELSPPTSDEVKNGRATT